MPLISEKGSTGPHLPLLWSSKTQVCKHRAMMSVTSCANDALTNIESWTVNVAESIDLELQQWAKLLEV